MTKLTQTVAAFVLITSLVGCADSYDKVAADMLANMKLINQTLKTVIDQSSSEAAAAKLRGLGVKMVEIQDRLNHLGKPTKEQGDQLNSKFSAEITAVGNEIAKERNRINAMGVAVSKPINEAYLSVVRPSGSSH